jgi:hypothetical protein
MWYTFPINPIKRQRTVIFNCDWLLERDKWDIITDLNVSNFGRQTVT